MPEMRMSQTAAVRLGGVAVGLFGAWLVHKLVDAAWRRAVGHDTPDAADRNSSLAETVVSTAITGALIALVRGLTQRLTERGVEVLEAHENGA